MKISTKGRYAIRMMLDLAENYNSGYISLKDIADRQEISKKYLEQIVSLLNKSKLLKTNRGFQGGYSLIKEPKEYSLGEILRITEGDLAPVACLATKDNKCSRKNQCLTLPIWNELKKIICNYLDNITLQDILDNNNKSIVK